MSLGKIKIPKETNLPDNLGEKSLEEIIYCIVQKCEVEVDNSEWQKDHKKLDEKISNLIKRTSEIEKWKRNNQNYMDNKIPNEKEYIDTKAKQWDMSQERVMTMSLVNQRITFFLVFFSIVIGGAFSTNAQIYMNIILCIGAVLSWLLAIPIFYTQLRVDKVMEYIRKDEDHPYSIVSSETAGHVRVSALMSYIVTTLCCILLTGGALLALFGILEVV